MIATLLVLFACTAKPSDSGGDWDSFENQTWTVTTITDNAGGPGLHPWGLIDDCPDAGGACVTCFRMEASSETLTVWTSEGDESTVAYTPLGGLLTYRLTELGADSGTSTSELDGETAVDWFIWLEAGGYNRRLVDFLDRSGTQDRMNVEAGCPFTVPE